MTRLTVIAEELRDDVRGLTKRMDTAIELGSAHRQEMDRRITRLEAERERFISYKQLVTWMLGAGASGAAGGGGIAFVITRLGGG